MVSSRAPLIALAPDDAPSWMADAIVAGGGEVVAAPDCAGLIWGLGHDSAGLERVLARAPQCRWVQLPFSGVERFSHLFERDDAVTWACAKGAFAMPVAELALGLGLAGLRGIGTYAQATSWGESIGRNLVGGRVTIFGGGGIAQALISLLQPFDVTITVVRNRIEEMEGVSQVVGIEHGNDVFAGADLVVLALALTPETDQLIGAGELSLMESHAWLVNVARGRHVVTDDLVEALRGGVIGGAALDVTDPEPLPDGHPLWTMPNCIITPHTASNSEMERPLFSARIIENVRRFAAGDELVGVVAPELGY